MVYLNKPNNFTTLFTVVSCVFIYNEKTLLLHRPPEKSQGNKWGMPSGKVEEGETLIKAMKREILEETGVKGFNDKELHHFKKFWVDTSGKQFEYHLYYLKFNIKPLITLYEYEHDSYKWIPLKECIKEDLVADHPECMKIFIKEYYRK